MLSMASHSQHRLGWGVIEGKRCGRGGKKLNWITSQMEGERQRKFRPKFTPFELFGNKNFHLRKLAGNVARFPKGRITRPRSVSCIGQASSSPWQHLGRKIFQPSNRENFLLTFSQWWNFTHFPFFFRSTLSALKSPSTWHRIILFTRVEQRNQKLLRHLNVNAAASGNRKKGERWAEHCDFFVFGIILRL